MTHKSTPKQLFQETLHGIPIEDNYRHFADRKNQEVLGWIKTQSQNTRAYLDEKNLSATILKEVNELEKIKPYNINSVTETENYFYYLKRFTEESKSKLYRYDIVTKEEIVLYEESHLQQYYPNESIQIDDYNVSPNEQYLYLKISITGNEKGFGHILDLNTFEFKSHKIDKLRFGVPIWSDDNSFFYMSALNSNLEDKSKQHLNTEILLHQIDKPNEKLFVFNAKTKPEFQYSDRHFSMPYFHNGKLYIHTHYATENIVDLIVADWDNDTKTASNWTKIFGIEEKINQLILHKNDIYFASSKISSNYELRVCPIDNFDFDQSKVLSIPTDEVVEDLLEDKGHLYITTLKNASNQLYKLDFATQDLISIELPAGSFYIEHGFIKFLKRPIFRFTNFTTPMNQFTISADHKMIPHPILYSPLQKTINRNDYEVKVEEFTSHDGVKVPISYAYKKGVDSSKLRPTIIEAYGSYGSVFTPFFSSFDFNFIEKGGILAIPHVRGGGEKGADWHEAGKKASKSNSWHDLAFAAKHLIKKGLTSSEKLACSGTSAGGIAVGMAMIDYPDLFKVVISNVGCCNAIRFAYGQNPLGLIAENGDPVIEEEFHYLLKMDVFQNIKKGVNYPYVLATAGMKDDRVDYFEPAKMIAKLQEYTTNPEKIKLIAYENLGHGAMGSSKEDTFLYYADQMAFIEKILL